MGKVNKIAKQILELAEPISKDLDPENEFYLSEKDTNSEDENSIDDLAGTEHYTLVGRSKLRGLEEISLGPKYSGRQVSRQALVAKENDSDGVLSDSELNADSTDENFEEYNHKDYSKESEVSDSDEYSSENQDLHGEDDTFSGVSESSQSNSDKSYPVIIDQIAEEKAKRYEIQKIMESDQKNLVSKLAQATKADIEKGKAVKLQRTRFDSLLNIRMILQKALTAVNSLHVLEADNTPNSEKEPYKAAEKAAIELWNKLYHFRNSILSDTEIHETGLNVKLNADPSTPSSAIWEKIQDLDVKFSDNRHAVLDKWSSKTRSTMTLPLTEKLKPSVGQMSITSILEDQLANSEHLIKRTKIPRSCAPIQRYSNTAEDPNIYDDGSFYQMLLKDLVEQRKSGLLNLPAIYHADEKNLQSIATKESKMRKVVDTRASKGRKLRFTVHEKLQNFAAPEDRSSWEQSAVERLFDTLLGQKTLLYEDAENETTESEINENLRLFRS